MEGEKGGREGYRGVKRERNENTKVCVLRLRKRERDEPPCLPATGGEGVEEKGGGMECGTGASKKECVEIMVREKWMVVRQEDTKGENMKG